MRNLRKKEGITLIALVVTVIVLLILAGISISMITGQNGILNRAIEAKELTEIAAEKEAIELSVISAEMYRFNESNQYYIGTPLQDKTVNEANWNIIVINDTQKVYGTGWNYITTGTEIPDYGKTKYEWLVNYDKGEVIYLEKATYQPLSKAIAVTDGLIFNMDASNLNEDSSNWGDNITLYYYDSDTYDTTTKRTEAYNEQANYTSVTDYAGYDRQIVTDTSDCIDSTNVAFKFNGNNYIEIYNSNSFDFSNGLTFEFYGNISGNVSATTTDGFIGLFGLWNGKYNSQCNTRFGYYCPYLSLYYSLCPTSIYIGDYGSWSDEGYKWNQQYNIANFLDDDIYIIITFNNITSNSITQTIYKDGSLLDSGYISIEYYNAFLEASKELNYFELGRCTMSNSSNWSYAKCLCYTIRMYNRALSSDEVSYNWSNTVAYRNLLLKYN